MSAVRLLPPDRFFDRKQWSAITTASRWRGIWLVAHAWIVSIAAVGLAAWSGNPFAWLLAVVIVGGRQLGLAILMHEAAHGGLHSNQKINEFVGNWICAVPVGASLSGYRAYHLKHHRFTQQPEDPDLGLSAPFPISKDSFYRKAFRDLTGQTFIKQRAPSFRALFARHEPVLTDAMRDEETENFLTSGRIAMQRFLAVNVLLFGLFWLAGAGVWFFSVWMAAMATWFPFVTRVRNIAEHACTSTGADPFSHARTTHANLIERALIAPYWVNYHAEHHLFMYLPCYRLEEAHRLLSEKGLIQRVNVAPGYLDVIRLATSRQLSA